MRATKLPLLCGDLTLQPATDALVEHLKQVNSPVLRLAQAAQRLFSEELRCKPSVIQRNERDSLLETVFIFTQSPDRIGELLKAGRGTLRKTAATELSGFHPFQIQKMTWICAGHFIANAHRRDFKAVKLKLYPVSETTLAALRFINSPFMDFVAVMGECGLPLELSIDEQMHIVLERVGKRMSDQWEEMYLGVFCFVCEPIRLKKLLDGTLDDFRRNAQREILGVLSPEQLRGLIEVCFGCLGHYLGKKQQSDGGKHE